MSEKSQSQNKDSTAKPWLQIFYLIKDDIPSDQTIGNKVLKKFSIQIISPVNICLQVGQQKLSCAENYFISSKQIGHSGQTLTFSFLDGLSRIFSLKIMGFSRASIFRQCAALKIEAMFVIWMLISYMCGLQKN